MKKIRFQLFFTFMIVFLCMNGLFILPVIAEVVSKDKLPNYLQSTDDGDAIAQCNLEAEVYYANGYGVKQDLKLSLEPNHKAVDQEQGMGEVLVADKQEVAEKKEALYSDKFAGAKTISEYFAWNLAKATDNMLKGFNDQTPEERKQINELRDALRSHAEYEIEGDGFSLMGDKVSTMFEQVLGKFEKDDAKDRIKGFSDTRMEKSNEVQGLKKHGVYEKFRKEVHNALEKSVDDFVKDQGEQVALNKEVEAKPALEVAPLASAQETVISR